MTMRIMPDTNHPVTSHSTSPVESSQASILELIVMRVRLSAHRRALWLAHLGASKSGPSVSFEIPFSASLDYHDTPSEEVAWFAHAEDVRSLNDQLAEVEQALAGKAGSALQQLAGMFTLSQSELDLLQTCVAFEIDPSLPAVFGYLQRSGRAFPTEALAARLFGYGRQSLWSPSCPLAVWKLVIANETPRGEPLSVTADPAVADWLQGELRMDSRLVGIGSSDWASPSIGWLAGDFCSEANTTGSRTGIRSADTGNRPALERPENLRRSGCGAIRYSSAGGGHKPDCRQ